MKPLEKLFSSFRIGTMDLKNRMAMSGAVFILVIGGEDRHNSRSTH